MQRERKRRFGVNAIISGTTLMSLVTSCTLASLLLSLGKKLSFNKKKKIKKTLKPPSTQVSFFYVSIVHTSAHFQKKNQLQELWQVSEKGCVCMLHVKHSENKVPGKWHLKHNNRYFHAQLLHITDIRRCRSPPRLTFCQKKSSFHVARQGK